MSPYETVTILTVVGAVAIGLVDYLRSGGPLTQLSRQGTLWFAHPDDEPMSAVPLTTSRTLRSAAPAAGPIG